jgi:hypothetical protein
MFSVNGIKPLKSSILICDVFIQTFPSSKGRGGGVTVVRILTGACFIANFEKT